MNVRITVWVLVNGIAFFFTACDLKPKIRVLPATDVHGIVNDSVKVNQYIVLDLRTRLDYVRGHLVSAMWMPVDSLPRYMELIKSEKRPLIIYDNEGADITRASALFSANDVDDFYILEGGFKEWMSKGYPAAIQLVINTTNKIEGEVKIISSEELQSCIQADSTSFAVIDLRPTPAYQERHIKNALSIPYSPLNEFVVKMEEQNFSRDKPIVVYCDVSSKDIGLKATEVLLRNLYTNVYLLDGGVEGWSEKGYSMEYYLK
jgi:rhodanese-related sulfurtransferase